MKGLSLILATLIFANAYATATETKAKDEHTHEKSESHAHGEGENEDHDAKADHQNHEGHDEAQEGSHHDEEEGGGSVGPEKGITEANEKTGIKLSPEAVKNFDLKTIALKGNGPWTLAWAAKLEALEEVNLYRKRDGAFKRIDFTITKKTGDQMTITSKDLKAGDEVVTNGVGFLRIAELAAFGGAPEGHSH